MSFYRSIGDPLTSTSRASEHYQNNADSVLGYLLKHGDLAAMEAMGLHRWGHRGWIMGKRCRSTQNIAAAAQKQLDVGSLRGVIQSSLGQFIQRLWSCINSLTQHLGREQGAQSSDKGRPFLLSFSRTPKVRIEARKRTTAG